MSMKWHDFVLYHLYEILITSHHDKVLLSFVVILITQHEWKSVIWNWRMLPKTRFSKSYHVSHSSQISYHIFLCPDLFSFWLWLWLWLLFTQLSTLLQLDNLLSDSCIVTKRTVIWSSIFIFKHTHTHFLCRSHMII